MQTRSHPWHIVIVYALALLVLVSCNSRLEDCKDNIVLKTAARASFSNKIYVVSSDGSGEIRCRLPKKIIDTPVWSPDGKSIVYGAQHDSKSGAKSQIFVLLEEKRHFQLTNESDGGTKPVWSYEGRRIAYETTKGISVLDVSCLYDQTECQFSPTFLTIGVEPDWSPVDDLIVYIYNKSPGASDVRVVDISNPNSIVNVTPSDVKFCNNPKWSPSGETIAVSCYKNENHDIYLIEWKSLKSINLTNSHNFIEVNPAWSPDGNRISFVSDRDDDLGKCLVDECTVVSKGLFVMNMDGSNITRISFRSDEHIIWYSWIP